MRRNSAWWVSFVVVITALVAPGRAFAGGLEFSATGTRSLGRGGAFIARADDPMALTYNPALLADLSHAQALLNAHLVFWNACFQRAGVNEEDYEDTVFAPTSANESFTQVCNEGPPQPIPWLLGSYPILPELGIGFGIVAPAGVGSTRWGDDGRVDGPNGVRPVSLRGGVAEMNQLLFHPSVGIGWRPANWIRIGFTFQWGIGVLSQTNFTNSSDSSLATASDIQTKVSFMDWFVPAGILAVHLQPHSNFDIALTGRISDALGGITSANGHLELTPRYFATDDLRALNGTTRIDNVTLRAGQPWTFAAAFRYADRIRPHAWERGFEASVRGVVDDAMYSDNFDIELDVIYELNSQVGDFVVTPPRGAAVEVDGADASLPAIMPIPHGWKDNVVVRLGSDWNVVPGVLALRAGSHVDIPTGISNYQTNDFIQGLRVGLHVGTTLRLDRFDISLAYAHIFQTDTVIGGDANFRGVASSGREGWCGEDYDPKQPVVSRGCYPFGYGEVVNQGRFSASFDVLSLGMTYHFE